MDVSSIHKRDYIPSHYFSFCKGNKSVGRAIFTVRSPAMFNEAYKEVINGEIQGYNRLV